MNMTAHAVRAPSMPFLGHNKGDWLGHHAAGETGDVAKRIGGRFAIRET